MDTLPDDFLVTLETGLRWSAVNEAVWRTRRVTWTADCQGARSNPKKVANLLLEV